MTPGMLGRILDDHGDALYDFALAVTDSPRAATEVVREAIPAAAGIFEGPPTRAALLHSVLKTVTRRSPGTLPLAGDLLQAGSGSGDALARVTREVARALPTEARGVLDLVLRQGLEGEDLGVALGVPQGQVSAASRTTLEAADHVIGSVLLARVARAGCTGLDALVSEWTPEAGLERLAGDVAAHQRGCTACDDRRRALVPVTSLLAAVPPTPAPAGLLERGSPTGDDDSPPGTLSRRRLRPLLAGAIAGAAVLVASGLMLTRGGEEVPGRAAAGGNLEVPDGLDIDAGGTTAVLELTNSGVEPLEFSVLPGAPWLLTQPAAGRVPPGDRVALLVAVDRERAHEGAVGEVKVRSSGGTTVVPVRAGVERPPTLSGLAATPEAVVRVGCPGAGPVLVRVSVVEESGIDRVELHHRSRRGGEQVSTMSRDGVSWTSAIGPFDRSGTVRWWVTAVDIRGNATTSSPAGVTVSGC